MSDDYMGAGKLWPHVIRRLTISAIKKEILSININTGFKCKYFFLTQRFNDIYFHNYCHSSNATLLKSFIAYFITRYINDYFKMNVRQYRQGLYYTIYFTRCDLTLYP